MIIAAPHCNYSLNSSAEGISSGSSPWRFQRRGGSGEKPVGMPHDPSLVASVPRCYFVTQLHNCFTPPLDVAASMFACLSALALSHTTSLLSSVSTRLAKRIHGSMEGSIGLSVYHRGHEIGAPRHVCLMLAMSIDPPGDSITLAQSYITSVYDVSTLQTARANKVY